MIDPTLLIAIIVAVSATVQTIISGWQAKIRQRADWRRQDEVARKIDKVAVLAAVTSNETRSQLSEIHIAVNSKMTEALQSDLNQTRITLALLHQMGNPDLSLTKITESRVRELERVLGDRPK